MALNPAYGGSGGGGGGGSPALEHGQVRLTKSGADLLLSRYNGSSLFIDGTVETVPSAGVILAATGLTIDTDHFIYAFMAGATMTLEASTTGHVTDSSTGVEIKSGDSTRTLVGMARPITGPVWADTDAQRFVISWFNRRTITVRKDFSADRTTTSTTEIELSTDYRAEFLIWDDEMPLISFSGRAKNSDSITAASSRSVLDTTFVSGFCGPVVPASNQWVPVAVTGAPLSAAEGYHFSTLFSKVSSGTGTWNLIFNTTIIRG